MMKRSAMAAALAVATSLVAFPATVQAAEPAWMTAVHDALGRTGKAMPGDVYRVGLARSDLHVTVDGVDVKPALALGSWLAFSQHDGNGMVMGDLVLTADEVKPVMRRLEQGGIAITALHNHLLRNQPFTMYMHVEGHGDPAKLAATLRGALSESRTPLQDPAPAGAAAPTIDLDTAAIDGALGANGTVNGGVYQMSIARAEPIRDGDMDVPEAMGSAIAINFQPTGPGKAAITGDFVLTAKEVNPVLKALAENGIEVTALHNHMLDDQPRLFFMHFWATDDVTKLTTGLRAALAAVNRKKPG